MSDYKNIKFNFDTTDFEKKLNQVVEEVKNEQSEMLRYCANVYANAAYKNTPPFKNGVASATIDKKLYERPYLILGKLIRKGYKYNKPTAEDFKRFRQGYKFKVLDTKNGKKDTLKAYCKTKSELKRLCRIHNRGLARVMWGKNLGDVGANVPVGLQKLMNKSPNLSRLNFNHVSEIGNADVKGIEIENASENIERIAKHAEAKADNVTKKALLFRLKYIAQKERNI